MVYQIQKNKVLLSLVTGLLLFVSVKVNAAEFILSAPYSTFGIGEEVSLDVLLNSTEGVNAVEGVVSWTKNTLEVIDTCECGSVINFWIEKMKVSEMGNAVSFSGVIPGGYNGTGGKLFTLRLRTKTSGISRFVFSNTRALLNDGKGTVATLNTAPLTIIVSGEKAPRPTEETKDITPPEPFTPIVSRDQSIFDNQWFVVFETQDKQTGVDRYEISESKIKNPTGPWLVAQSPYLLKDQTLKSYIYIKAVDKNGNIRVAVIKPKMNYTMLGIFLVLILIIAIVWVRSRHKYQRITY